MDRRQEVDKHAKIAMAIISGIIIFLFIIALSGCHNNCTHKQVDWEDSHEWHGMWYDKNDTNSDGDIDSLRIRTWEIEDPYPYELGE